MEEETPNDSVRTLLLLLAFAATKMVACIVLMFFGFFNCAHLFFKFLLLGFQIWDLALDLLSRFLFGLDGCSPVLFFLVKGLALPTSPDVESLSLLKDIFFSLCPIDCTNWCKTWWIFRHLLPWWYQSDLLRNYAYDCDAFDKGSHHWRRAHQCVCSMDY